MRLSELEQKRSAKFAELSALVDARDQASREFTDVEATQFDALEAEVKTLDETIARERKAEEIRKQSALKKADRKTDEEKLFDAFSFSRAIAGAGSGKLDGAEKEMSDEGRKEAIEAGAKIEGRANAFFIPNRLMRFGKTRDLTSGGAATGEELVSDDFKGNIYGLHITPQVMSLGATLLSGLTGDAYFTKTGTASAVWATENATSTETTISTARVTLSPKRLTAFHDVSGTLLTQTNGAGERYAKEELAMAIAVALDAAAINGSGSAPTGLLSISGVNEVNAGGALPTRSDFLSMRKKIAEDNADNLGALAILMTPGVYFDLADTPIDAGSGLFINQDGRITGLPAYFSNNVPSDLGVGENYHAVIMGIWSQLLIGQWGGAEIIVNPYTKAKENLVELIVNTNWDIDVRNAQAFCKIVDALPS